MNFLKNVLSLSQLYLIAKCLDKRRWSESVSDSKISGRSCIAKDKICLIKEYIRMSIYIWTHIYWCFLHYRFVPWKLTFDDRVGSSIIALQLRSFPRQNCPMMSFGIPINFSSAIKGSSNLCNWIKASENCILEILINFSVEN